ncbi:MAG: ComEA family DNA-binding protein [Candidatus Marinimicrobia bacterium]|jgi:comEA protein|nr:ComEA family DNA-binding protein [Candidatus Neomarinimicrobiota bacterium]MDP6401746.1 ComEA family DNA-binding protein [Candidatus Neomarinimicrobiota bacterium]|tara:strand:+ start:4805 stop:5245 length:441 start_codon:yes stop_codon:yes gene_type:complete
MTLLTKQEKWVFVFLCTTLVSGYLIQYMKQRNMDDSLHIISKTEKEEFKQAALHAYSSQGIQDNETPNIAAGDATEKNIKDGEELVNINTAVKQELMALPKIGPVTAERIIRFRDDFGPFQSIDDLAKIKGIGPKTLERLKTRIII